VGLFWQLLKSPDIGAFPSMLGLLATMIVLLSLGKRTTPAALFGAIIMLGAFITVAYYSLTSSWIMWSWYFWAAPVAVTLSFPSAFVRLFGDVRPAILAVLRTAATLILLAVFGAYILHAVAPPTDRRGPFAWAPWVANQLAVLAPDTAPLAMGDRAGVFSYHLDRPLINLEGIVGSPEFLRALQYGQVPKVLRDAGVQYYANASGDPGTEDTGVGRGCRRFIEPFQGAGPKFPVVVCDSDLIVAKDVGDGQTFRVWRYRSELNP
jgi:hypothetical protein